MRNDICMTHECNCIQYDAIPTVVHDSFVPAIYNKWSRNEARPWLLMFHYWSLAHIVEERDKTCNKHVTVLCRNWRWSLHILETHHIRGAVLLCFHKKTARVSQMLRRCIYIYKVRISHALHKSSALYHFKYSDASEIYNRITFNFYIGLPHMTLQTDWLAHLLKVVDTVYHGGLSGGQLGENIQ